MERTEKIIKQLPAVWSYEPDCRQLLFMWKEIPRDFTAALLFTDRGR